METSQSIAISVKKGESTFVFYMPMASTWGEALDASFAVLHQVNKMSQDAIKKADPVKEDIKEA